MPESRKIVKVFLASPGDLSDERKAAKREVDEFNKSYSDHFGYQIELVGWEDTTSAFGRPQAIINRDLDRCEYFVGLIWRKWGTPPDTKGRFTSGFEEEFETSVAKREREGRPEISLFVKSVDPELLTDPGEDLLRVMAFKRKLIDSKKILFKQFDDVREFESKFRSCISGYIIDLVEQDKKKSSAQTQSPISKLNNQKSSPDEARIPDTPLSNSGEQFLRTFASKSEESVEDGALNAEDIARFRLLGTIVNSPGNDYISLGVHDANLLFSHRESVDLGQREIEGLLKCGLVSYSSATVPVWHWLDRAGGFAKSLLPFQSIFDSTGTEAIGALSMMRLISEPLPGPLAKQRKLFLDRWFSVDAKNEVKVAALAYLGACGVAADLPAIHREWERNDHQTASSAANAIIRITLRESVDQAVASLVDLQSAGIDEDLLDEIFEKSDSISVANLLRVVAHRHPSVRCSVVKSLRIQGALPQETADQLIRDDENAQTRYEALKSLIADGRTFTKDEVKQALIKTLPPSGLGLISGAMVRTNGEECWADYQLEQLRKLDQKALEQRAIRPMLVESDAFFINVERNFKRLGDDLRRAIDDGFEKKFTESFSALEKIFNGRSDSISKVEALKGDMCREFTDRALEIIYRMKDPKDLNRVRTAFQGPAFARCTSAFEYLRKFGEWADIPLIINAISRQYTLRGASLLGSMQGSHLRDAALTIHSLGRTRLPEVMRMPTPTGLKCQIICSLSDTEFRSFSDTFVRKLLQSEHDAVRKVVALKCVASLNQQRIELLLRHYLAGEEHSYYNVIHWLDFGASCPKRRATNAAKLLLEEEAPKT